MILTKEVLVKLNNKNISHYQLIGIDCKYGDEIMVPVSYLPKYSKYKIVAQCDNCKSENDLSMQKYSKNVERGGIYTCKSCVYLTLSKALTEKYGFDNPSKIPEFVNQRKETCLEKFGTEYAIASKHSREKSKKTFIDRYGVDHQMKVIDFRFKGVQKSNKTKLERGLIFPDELLDDWCKYRKLVRKLTNRNKKNLFETWDGYDFYDGEYIKDNFCYKHTHCLFPTIDHKISIIYGFKNNIGVEEISNIKNLCITKKRNNSSKSFLNESEFKEKIQSL